MDPIIGGVILGKVIYDMHKSDQLNEQAERKQHRALKRIAEARANQEQTIEIMEKAILRLTNRKNAVLVSTMDSFLTLYEKIIRINFTESEGIRELGNFTPAVASEMQMQISTIRNLPNTPTVTKNVVIGYLIGGLAGAVTSSIVDDSKRNLDQARIQSRQADAIVAQAQTVGLAYQGITERVNRMTDVLTKLNLLFYKGIQESEQLIKKNGSDKRKYTENERQTLAACINVAGAVKGILDTPIIDRDGELTKKSLEAIACGEKCLQAIDAVINEI